MTESSAASAGSRRSHALSAGRLRRAPGRSFTLTVDGAVLGVPLPTSTSTSAMASRSADELEAKTELVRPEEHRLPGLRTRLQRSVARDRDRLAAALVQWAGTSVASPPRVDTNTATSPRTSSAAGSTAMPTSATVATELTAAAVRQADQDDASHVYPNPVAPMHTRTSTPSSAVSVGRTRRASPTSLERGAASAWTIVTREQGIETETGRRRPRRPRIPPPTTTVRFRYEGLTQNQAALDRCRGVLNTTQYGETKTCAGRAPVASTRQVQTAPPAGQISEQPSSAEGRAATTRFCEPQDDLLLDPGCMRTEEELHVPPCGREILLREAGPLIDAEHLLSDDVTTPS